MPANSVIQLRRGTAAQWTTANPVLEDGEPGYEKDTGKEKRGDGTTAWTSLAYFAPGTGTFAPLGPAISGDTTGATDAANVQAELLAAAGGGLAHLTRPGVLQVNAPLYVPFDAKVVIGPQTTIKAVGTFPAGSDLLQDALPTTVAAGSNGAATSAGTLNVASTTGYPPAGQVRVAITGGTAIIAYTGKTGTSFTGCTQAGGAVGTFATGNKVSARTYNGRISGGGVLDSNNLARHALWLHFIAGCTVEATCQNSLQDDIVLGDANAVSTSYGVMLGNGSGGMLTNRTSGNLPVGYRSVWITVSCSDSSFLGRAVVVGQETGVQIDGSDCTGQVHAWSPFDGTGNGLHTAVYDNGLRNSLEIIADTPSVYGLRLGTSQDQGSHRGLAFLNSIQGVDNVAVAVRNDGGLKYNTLDFMVMGADSSHRWANEYTGNYGKGRYNFRSVNCVAAFRRNLFIADADSATSAQLLMGAASGTQDIGQWYSQSGGVLGTKLGSIDSLGNLNAPAVKAVRQSSLRPTGAQYETISRSAGMASVTALTSGTLFLTAVELPMGCSVPGITFVSGNVAVATPSHWWFALLDNSLNLLALTADMTSTAWPTFTAKTLTATASDGSTTFKTTYSGLHYLGIMVAATTVPSLMGASPGTAVPGLAPVLYGNSDTSQTAPPAFPHQATSLTAVGASPYAYV